MGLFVGHADDLERYEAETLGIAVTDLGALHIRAVHIVIKGQFRFIGAIIICVDGSVLSDLKHVLRFIGSLVSGVGL